MENGTKQQILLTEDDIANILTRRQSRFWRVFDTSLAIVSSIAGWALRILASAITSIIVTLVIISNAFDPFDSKPNQKHALECWVMSHQTLSLGLTFGLFLVVMVCLNLVYETVKPTYRRLFDKASDAVDTILTIVRAWAKAQPMLRDIEITPLGWATLTLAVIAIVGWQTVAIAPASATDMPITPVPASTQQECVE